ncbi:MAG: pantoate--beta-alanine ligase [Hyphomicrobiaceae bacterium]
MPAKPRIVRTIKALRASVSAWHRQGEAVAVVPTMGALHDGHLTLVRRAHDKARRVIVTIFVNPTQFAAHEDLDRYPRDEAGDLAKLATVGVDLVYVPAAAVMYPEGFATRIEPKGAADGLESLSRPHFFSGVATVVAKLLLQTSADFAMFGEKDYQQLMVVTQLVRDLDIPCEIVGVATERAPDGLALSSRNAYLSAEERAIAPALNQVLRDTARALQTGSDARRAIAAAKRKLTAAGFRVDYLELRDARTLGPADATGRRPRRLLAAAWLGRTRLIDNTGV